MGEGAVLTARFVLDVRCADACVEVSKAVQWMRGMDHHVRFEVRF